MLGAVSLKAGELWHPSQRCSALGAFQNQSPLQGTQKPRATEDTGDLVCTSIGLNRLEMGYPSHEL